MMKQLLTIALVIFLAVNAALSQDDAKAKEILSGVSAKYKSYKSLSASFRLEVTDQQNKTTEKQTGSILIKANKYKLTMGNQEVYCDGKAVWTYLKDANEVQVNEPKSDPDAITPSSIFTMYEKGYRSKFIQEKIVAGKSMQVVELIPEDKKKNFFKVQLTINKTEKYVAQAKIFQRNGTNLFYAVDKFTPNAEAPDASFAFDKTKYPGVEVTDLR